MKRGTRLSLNTILHYQFTEKEWEISKILYCIQSVSFSMEKINHIFYETNKLRITRNTIKAYTISASLDGFAKLNFTRECIRPQNYSRVMKAHWKLNILEGCWSGRRDRGHVPSTDEGRPWGLAADFRTSSGFGVSLGDVRSRWWAGGVRVYCRKLYKFFRFVCSENCGGVVGFLWPCILCVYVV